MGRNATGVRGIHLTRDDLVVGMEILTNPDAKILTTTERGYGKRTPLEDYRPQNRGGQGIINIRANERNGSVVGIAQVFDDDDVMLITDGGKVLRCPVGGISSMGRATQGVRVMNLSNDEKLVSIARVTEEDVVEGEADELAANAAPRPTAALERDGDLDEDDDAQAAGDEDAEIDSDDVDDADLDADSDEGGDDTPDSDDE